MLEEIKTEKLHSCNLCGRRIPKPVKTCCVCKLEICQYCKIILTTKRRKYPDSGYIIIQKKLGDLCIQCAEDKLGLKKSDMVWRKENV